MPEKVAKWTYEQAKKRTDAEFELVDIKDFNLPVLDEPFPPSMGQYSKPHTLAWARKVASFDGYIFVTPEYNHGPKRLAEERHRLCLRRVEQQGGRVRRALAARAARARWSTCAA